MKENTVQVSSKFSLDNPNLVLKDLIINLLIKDKTKRLGTNGGVDEVISHPWFSDLDLESIKSKSIRAPYVPELENYGLNHFDELFVNESIIADEEDFRNFSHPAEKFYSGKINIYKSFRFQLRIFSFVCWWGRWRLWEMEILIAISFIHFKLNNQKLLNY